MILEICNIIEKSGFLDEMKTYISLFVKHNGTSIIGWNGTKAQQKRP